MKKLYKKSEVAFALVWIGLYVIVMNVALHFCGGFDDLANKTVPQMLVPVICITLLALASTLWVIRNSLAKEFGLCRFRGNAQSFLWFLPLVIMSCINIKNGLTVPAPLPVTVLMSVNLAAGGYVEEIIFRGFLFRGMAKENLRSAIVVSAVTFGAGHIVNLFNTADHFGVLLQIAYAIVVGFLYTIIAHKGGSLWPCIASHIFVNASSVFAADQGPFTRLVAVIFGQATTNTVQVCSAVLVILISGSYALWLWRKQ